jgi:hypothetical protein
MALTSWGLLRYAGYARQPFLTISQQSPTGGNYINNMLWMDVITSRWNEIDISKDTTDILFGQIMPAARYLTSMVFIPAQALTWRSKLSERSLYDQNKRSYQSNFQGTVADTVMVFGGFNGATGRAVDGSQGGYFNDIWMLRLNRWSTSANRQTQQAYMNTRCRSRRNPSAQAAGALSCMSSVANTKCRQRDLLLLAWCEQRNQTLA